MKCDVLGCENNATVIEKCVNYCVKHYLEQVKGKKLELKPAVYVSNFLELWS
jgi:hypothetical protein